MKKTTGSTNEVSPSQRIDARIEELDDWRGAMLARIRALIQSTDPEVIEEWKWRGVPVWSHDGMICTGETYKAVVKLTFAKGAALKDPAGLFNSSLEGNTRRAIDIREGEAIDEKAFKALVLAAVELNGEKRGKSKAAAGAVKSKTAGKTVKSKAAAGAVKSKAAGNAKKSKTAGKTVKSKTAAATAKSKAAGKAVKAKTARGAAKKSKA